MVISIHTHTPTYPQILNVTHHTHTHSLPLFSILRRLAMLMLTQIGPNLVFPIHLFLSPSPLIWAGLPFAFFLGIMSPFKVKLGPPLSALPHPFLLSRRRRVEREREREPEPSVFSVPLLRPSNFTSPSVLCAGPAGQSASPKRPALLAEGGGREGGVAWKPAADPLPCLRPALSRDELTLFSSLIFISFAASQ